MSPAVIVWKELVLAKPLAEDQASAALAALCALSGGPFVTLETEGRDHLVRWRIGFDPHDAGRVGDVLRAHLPGLHLTAGRPTDRQPDAAARLHLNGSAGRPLAARSAEATTRTLLAALARAGAREFVALQVTLGPRKRPAASKQSPGRDGRAAAEKRAAARFACDVRVGASAADPDRVRALVNGVIAAVRTLEVPGVGVAAVRTRAAGFEDVALPWFWRSEPRTSRDRAKQGWKAREAGKRGATMRHLQAA